MKLRLPFLSALTATITVAICATNVHAKEHEDEDDDGRDEHHERHEHRGEHHRREGGERKKDDSSRTEKKGSETNKQAGSDKLPPASTKQGVTFEKDIAPLFEDACTRCHGEDKQKAKLRLDTLAAVIKGSEDGAVVVPGQSAKSKLVISVACIDPETAMPPQRKGGGNSKRFTAEQVGLIRAWIDQGAK